MKFGIIVPTYNRPRHLEACVAAALSQTYGDWIIVICNDASTIDYTTIVEQWKNDPRIIYIKRDKNGGCNAARNTAIDEAASQGADYIIFCDDEETLDPRCLETAAETINAHSDVGWYISNTSGETKSSSRKIVRDGYYDWIDDYSYGPALRGDKTHIIALTTLVKIRFDGRYRASNMWPFYLKLAARTKIWGYSFPSKKIQYLEGGITKTNNRYPRTWLEIYSRFYKHALAIQIRPSKIIAVKYLLIELLKTPKRIVIMLLKKWRRK